MMQQTLELTAKPRNESKGIAALIRPIKKPAKRASTINQKENINGHNQYSPFDAQQASSVFKRTNSMERINIRKKKNKLVEPMASLKKDKSRARKVPGNKNLRSMIGDHFYKFHVGKGNNGALVQRVIGGRWWWRVDDPEKEGLHFNWSQGTR